MFIDKVTVQVESGSGGNGIVSWRREKYVPFGGPAGGDGGRGGSVYLEATEHMQTLMDFRYKFEFRAENGEKGGTKNCHGHKGKDLTLLVPVGTIVRDAATGDAIADLREHGQRILVAQGGRGGRGNARFASSKRQAPHFAEPGELGIRRQLEFELKLIADVGIIGMPNAGKSTLISVISAAKPKIADYPFTTLVPNLGTVKKPNGDAIVIADIPGLIEGASEGHGLGHEFLRHVERTRLLLHLVEMDPVDQEDPVQHYEMIRRELARYSPKLAQKPEILVLTKQDAVIDEMVDDLIQRFREKLGGEQEIFVISAVARQGLEPLVARMIERVEALPREQHIVDIVPDTRATDHEDGGFSVRALAPGYFELRGSRVRRWLSVTDLTNQESLFRLWTVFQAMGVIDALRKAGAQYGDTVSIGKLEFEFLPEGEQERVREAAVELRAFLEDDGDDDFDDLDDEGDVEVEYVFARPGEEDDDG
jgi:GTP-binding protein